MNNHLLIDKPALYFISIITSALHTQRFQKSSGACGTPEKNTEKKKKHNERKIIYTFIFIYQPHSIYSERTQYLATNDNSKTSEV